MRTIERGVSSGLIVAESLRTLDAIHLATALLWQETAGTRLVVATHDAALGLAARAHGFAVVG